VFFSFTPVSQLRWPSIPESIEWGTVAIGFVTFVILVRQTILKILPSFLVGYLSVVLVWPWLPHRFLVPVLPYLFAYSMTTIVGGVKSLKRPGWILQPVACVLIVLLLIVNLITVGKDIIESKANRYPHAARECP
jgi:uncharacterized membrane protein